MVHHNMNGDAPRSDRLPKTKALSLRLYLPEVVGPLAHAMRLVDARKGELTSVAIDVDALQEALEARREETLRRDVKDVDFLRAYAFANLVLVRLQAKTRMVGECRVLYRNSCAGRIVASNAQRVLSLWKGARNANLSRIEVSVERT